MTIQEKKSLRKKKSIIYLVEHGEYSLGYALLLVEELSDTGKLTEEDYNELADWLEELLNEVEEPIEEEQEEEVEESEGVEE